MNKVYYARDKMIQDHKINHGLNLSDILDDIMSDSLFYRDSFSRITREYFIRMVEREYQLDHETAFHISTLVKYYLPRLFKD
jgi:hypothetical protein